MKDCTDYIQNLCSYVDGEADDSICREIEKHLKDCPECRVMVDTLKKTVILCKEGEKIHFPDELRAKLESALEKKWKERFGTGADDQTLSDSEEGASDVEYPDSGDE